MPGNYGRRRVFLAAASLILLGAATASAAVDKVICVPWQGDVNKQHTALSGQAVEIKGVIKTSDTSAVYYKWVFGDGSESAVSALNGSTKYRVSTTHVYTAAAGTPFTAKLQVSNTSPFALVKEDPYFLKIEAPSQDAEINLAIDRGLWWLYKQGGTHSYSSYPHTYDGSPQMTWLQTGSVYTLVTPTASAVQAFGINGHKIKGNPDEDPYVEAVQLGMNYIVKGYNYYTSYPALQARAIAVQHVPDDPDKNGNGYGVEVYDWGASHVQYQSGQIMDAIIASGVDPSDETGRDFSRQNSSIGHNWTYGELLQDMADMHAWGQSDDNCNGGKCGSWWYGWNYNSGDNSASQWAAIGLLPAQQSPWNVQVPGWVKDYNANWLESSKCFGFDGNPNHNAFGYNSACGCAGDSCFQTTTSGMVQMIFAGQSTADAKWGKSQLYLADNWYSFLHRGSSWGNSMTYGWYSFAKAMRLSQPTATTQIAKSSGTPFDWYHGDATATSCTNNQDCRKGLAQRILEIQQPDGHWNGNLSDAPLTSAWMIITLKPTLFAASPIACFAASPNPSYADQDISFDPSCSAHSENGKGINNLVKFEWDWDNDGSFDASSSLPAPQSHQFSCATLPCSYPVKLQVTDDSTPARMATAVVNINITNPPHPPVAHAGGPYTASTCGSDLLVLDGSKSFDQDQGEHEAGCTTCTNDTITAWDWDLAAPLTFDAITKSGKTATVTGTEIASLFTPGSQSIGLRVSDNTAAAYPGSKQPNLTNAAFASVAVKSGCLCTITARAKTGMVQLNWAAGEHTPSTVYEIYRSTEGPNTGFVKIRSGYTNTYALFVDTGLTNGKTYHYRVEKKQANGVCGSKAVSATPVAL